MNVRFQPSEPIIYTYDKEDDTWYTREELKSIRASIRCILKSLKSGSECKTKIQEDDGENCIRGLESCHVPCFVVGSKFKNRKFVENILDVQSEHKDMGIKDPIGLSRFSMSQSKACQKRALSIAADDATIALRIHGYEIGAPTLSSPFHVQKNALAA